ncbi:nucleotide pyrophosphohydrolase [Candidatus Woesearchaeota archaeon]|nr:nucleotide pyrophosphohydrolase [Candidatus Woesearchaeota archaeon]
MKQSFEELVVAIKKTLEKCPWAKEQTIEKHKEEILSEAEEIAEAIDKKDYENLKEELGDLFYDILFICAISEEKKLFTTKEVIDGVKDKLVRRKPWVFGNETVKSSEEAVKRWDEIKKKERFKNKELLQ